MSTTGNIVGNNVTARERVVTNVIKAPAGAIDVQSDTIFEGNVIVKGTLTSADVSCQCGSGGGSASGEIPVIGEYDFVVVGSGPAGSVIAARLSETPTLVPVTVCLIEAGSDCTREPPSLPITDDTTLAPILGTYNNFWPALVRKGAFTWNDSFTQGFHNWQWLPKFRDTSAPNTRGGYYARGSNMGGSTTHAQTWVRNDTNDFDQWDTYLGYPVGGSPWTKNIMRDMYKLVENRGQTNNAGLAYCSSSIPNGNFSNLDLTTLYGTTPGVYTTTGAVDVLSGSDPAQFGGTYWIPPLNKAVIDSSLSIPNTAFRVANPPGTLVDSSHPMWEHVPCASGTVLSVQDQLGTLFPAKNQYNDGGIPYPPGTPFGLAGVVSDFQRVIAAQAYIYPVMNRTNLTVKTKTYVTKIAFDETNKAIGVNVLEDGYNVLDCGRQRNTELAGFGGTPQDAQYNAQRSKCNGYKRIAARKEVIICGGTYNSPHLLMLSGIGPRAHLESFGIRVLSDLPGVGQNVVDHAEIDHFHRMTPNLNYDAFSLGAGFNGYYDNFPTTRFKSHINQPPGSIYGNGPITDWDTHVHQSVGISFTPDSGGVLGWNDGRINIRKVGPPYYMHNRTNTATNLTSEIPYTNITWSLMEIHKYIQSYGIVRLRSADPCKAPEIIINWLESPVDQERFTGAFYNFLWPQIEGMRNSDWVMTSVTPPTTGHQGFGSWFEEWVWPTPDMMFDTLTLPNNPFTSNGATPSVITVNHPNHGLYSRYNGLTSNDVQTNKHYLRIRGSTLLPVGVNVNYLQYVQLVDANTYTFTLPGSTTVAAGTYGGPSVSVYAFNRTNYLNFAFQYCWGHHVSGSCKLGPASDPMAVLDDHCRVRGVTGLRVADCSISPFIHSANTQTASYIYGENAARLIKLDHPELF